MTLEELIVPSRRSSTSTTTPENLGDGLPGNLETPDNKSIFGPALSATIAPEDAIDRESLVDLEDSRRTETVPEISTYHNSDDLSPGNSETSSDDSAHSRSSHSVTSWEDCPEHSPPIIVRESSLDNAEISGPSEPGTTVDQGWSIDDEELYGWNGSGTVAGGGNHITKVKELALQRAKIQRKLDREALAKLQSMPVFEDGQQNRPIHTDVPRISRESTVEILLTRAGISSLREDYCMMEYYANSAIELAATLDHYPILARCHYKRGLARFEQRRWNEASEDFLRARGCAGHYGIESKMIKKWLQKVNRGLDAQTPTTPGPFASPNPNVLSVNNTGWNSSGSLSLENEKDIYSGSPVTDSTGLSLMGDGSIPNSKSTPTGYLPGSPREGYSPPPTFCSPTKEERSQAPSPGQGSPRLDRYISDGVSTWETDHSPFKEVPAPDMSPETAARQDAIRLEIYRAKDQQAAAGRKGYAASSHPGTGGERNPPGRLRTVAFNQEIETYPAPRSFASSGGTTLFGSVTSSLRSSSLRRERVPPIDTSARVTTTTPVRLDSEDASPAMPRTPEIDDGPSSALVRSLFGKDRGGLSDGTPVTPLTAVEAGDGSQTSTSISSTPGTDEGPSSPIFRSLFGKR